MRLSRFFLLLEFSVLMFVMPLLLLETGLQKFLLPGLWLITLYCVLIAWQQMGMSLRRDWQWAALRWEILRPMLLRFALCSAAMTVLTYFVWPAQFLGFISERPFFWALVMLLYPLLSVIAQEIVYRWFFIARYKVLFPNPRVMIAASAVTFAFGHIVLNNWIAPGFCFIGGAIFAATYMRHRSLSLVSLEHALYGDAVFTIGLGWYFYHGNVH